MKKVLYFLFLCNSCFLSYGQVSPDLSAFTSKLITPYLEYYSAPREQVYTHFNKSCYVPGDDIWLKCYVFDPASKLPIELSWNLYVELYDPNGKIADQKTLYLVNGCAYNSFNLKQECLPGTYTFRAYTRWMMNFNQPDQFSTFIPVLGKQKEDSVLINADYDISFFAESGTLLNGCTNTIAVKALDPNGQGVKLKGEIIDTGNDTIAAFTLNELGMGSFTIPIKSTATLTCVAHLPGGRIAKYTLPKIEDKGIITQVMPLYKDKVRVNVCSNSTTNPSDKKYYMAIHSNGVFCKTATFSFNSLNTETSIDFKKGELLNGVNCLTIFNEDFQPVAERLFYVTNRDTKGKLEVTPTRIGDSVELRLLATDTSGMPEAAGLSISVLPAGTLSNKFTSSLLADVLLKSGIRGNIENPQYYIENQDYEHQKDLDALLLTQGWRKYDWKEILQSSNRKPAYGVEKGFTLEGEVNNWLKGKPSKNAQIAITSPQNNIINHGDVDSTGRFRFINLLLIDSTNIVLTALDDKGKGWNRSISAKFVDVHTSDSIIKSQANYSLLTNSEPFVFNFHQKVIPLKEIEIKTERVKKENPFKDFLYKPDHGKYVEITEENYHKYYRVQELLKREFNVDMYVDPSTGEVRVIFPRGPQSISRDIPPVLVLNDVPMLDLSWLNILPLEDIEAVAVNKGADAKLGSMGGGGSIMIKTRSKPIEWTNKEETNRTLLKAIGYAKPAAYYTPQYALPPTSQVYIDYGTVFWDPNITTDSDGTGSVKFLVPKELDSLEIRMEGFSGSGTIFLNEQKIVLK